MLNINEVSRLYLGVQGENGARPIMIDVRPWLVAHPQGSITIWHKRNGDSVPSPTGAVFDSDEGTVCWTPSDVDTYVDGEGEAEIRLTEGTVIKKTRKVVTDVSPSVTLAGQTLGSDWQSYINAVDSIRAGAVAAQEAAEDAAEEAEAWATGTEDTTSPAYQKSAKEYAEAAAESADDAAESATAASGSATAAAGSADAASAVVAKFNDMTVAASGIAPGSAPTVTISEVSGHKHIEFGIPKGDPADPTELIDDTSTTDTDKVWSAKKSSDECSELSSAIESIEAATNDIPKTRDSDATGIDLDVSDTNGNVLVRFSGGHIKTKNFNSANTFPSLAPIDSDEDLAISDVNGNALVFFMNGQIQTKNFDSKYIRQLTGKKWTCLGDSLTEHNQRTTMNYHDYIAQETGITVFNLGHSGCGYAKIGGNGQNFTNQAANIPNDTDVITIFGSGNDGSSGLDIGTPTDSGNTTLCGYINATIDIIYANHPVTPLGIITPTPWENKEPSDGQTWMKDYSEAIIAICTRRGIPYLDLWHCSNLHPTDVNFRPLAYSKDDGGGVHPDETGHALIAPRIRQFMFSLI